MGFWGSLLLGGWLGMFIYRHLPPDAQPFFYLGVLVAGMIVDGVRIWRSND